MIHGKQLSIDGVKSNNKQICARCNAPIVQANFSGWEVFVDDGTKSTQPICIFCVREEDDAAEKAKLS
jgi:hypothetical protein